MIELTPKATDLQLIGRWHHLQSWQSGSARWPRHPVRRAPPAPQHRWLDAQAGRNLDERSSARRQQRHRLPFEVVRERTGPLGSLYEVSTKPGEDQGPSHGLYRWKVSGLTPLIGAPPEAAPHHRPLRPRARHPSGRVAGCGGCGFMAGARGLRGQRVVRPSAARPAAESPPRFGAVRRPGLTLPPERAAPLRCWRQLDHAHIGQLPGIPPLQRPTRGPAVRHA